MFMEIGSVKQFWNDSNI